MKKCIEVPVRIIVPSDNLFYGTNGIIKSIIGDNVFVELSKEFEEFCQEFFYGKRTFMFNIKTLINL